MRLFTSKIDRLSKKRQALIAKRDNAERAMREETLRERQRAKRF